MCLAFVSNILDLHSGAPPTAMPGPQRGGYHQLSGTKRIRVVWLRAHLLVLEMDSDAKSRNKNESGQLVGLKKDATGHGREYHAG